MGTMTRFPTAKDIGGEFHVLPIGDLVEHVESGSCWCQPTPDADGLPLWLHHSADDRELDEKEADLLTREKLGLSENLLVIPKRGKGHE